MRSPASFLKAYQNELAFLQTQGQSFSKAHPRIAEAIGFHSQDPHIQQLLHSFAFLSAKLQDNIDNAFEDFAELTLLALYPYAIHPVPSSAIMQIQADPKLSLLNSGGLTLPARTQLTSAAPSTCIMQTVYPLTLLPINLINCQITQQKNQSCLSLTLHIVQSQWSQVAGKTMTLSINSAHANSYQLYESMCRANCHPFFSNKDDIYESSSLVSLGFTPDQYAICNPNRSTFIEQLFSDYFYFPEKFLFFSMELPKNLPDSNVDIILHIPIAQGNFTIKPDSILLNTVPVVNMFAQTFEPIRYKHDKTRYLLAFNNDEKDTDELYDINEVVRIQEGDKQAYTIPFYHAPDHHDYFESSLFCLTKRVLRPGSLGSDVFISFVDLNMNPALPQDQVVFVKGYATNCQTPHKLNPGHRFSLQQHRQLDAKLLTKPTPSYNSLSYQDRSWVLLAHLNQSPLFKSGETAYIKQLSQLCMAYGRFQSHVQPWLNLNTLTSHPMTRRIDKEPWRGFLKGRNIEIDLKGSLDNAYLFSKILAKYLKSFEPLDSFYEISTRYQGKPLYKDFNV